MNGSENTLTLTPELARIILARGPVDNLMGGMKVSEKERRAVLDAWKFSNYLTVYDILNAMAAL